MVLDNLRKEDRDKLIEEIADICISGMTSILTKNIPSLTIGVDDMKEVREYIEDGLLNGFRFNQDLSYAFQRVGIDRKEFDDLWRSVAIESAKHTSTPFEVADETVINYKKFLGYGKERS